MEELRKLIGDLGRSIGTQGAEIENFIVQGGIVAFVKIKEEFCDACKHISQNLQKYSTVIVNPGVNVNDVQALERYNLMEFVQTLKTDFKYYQGSNDVCQLIIRGIFDSNW